MSYPCLFASAVLRECYSMGLSDKQLRIASHDGLIAATKVVLFPMVIRQLAIYGVERVCPKTELNMLSNIQLPYSMACIRQFAVNLAIRVSHRMMKLNQVFRSLQIIIFLGSIVIIGTAVFRRISESSRNECLSCGWILSFVKFSVFPRRYRGLRRLVEKSGRIILLQPSFWLPYNYVSSWKSGIA